MFCARTLRIRNPPEDNESSLAPGLIHVLDLTQDCCYWILPSAIGQS